MPNIHSQRQQHSNICIYLCLKDGFSQCSPLNNTSVESAAELRNHRLQRLNALACLSSAHSENQQTKAWQFRTCSVILAVQSSSYNKVVTVLNVLRASATVPKPWSHFCRKSLGKILFDLLWPQCHPLKIFHWRIWSKCSTFFRVPECRDVMLSCSPLRGRSGVGCSCPSQGRCRSRLSLSQVSQLL